MSVLLNETAHARSFQQFPAESNTIMDVPSSSLIEIGWVTDQKLTQRDREAVEQAREAMLKYCQRTFDAFLWHLPMVECQEVISYPREEPVILLEYGVHEREARHWDFALLVTAANLVSHYKPVALGTPSRSVSVAVLSIQKLTPKLFLPDSHAAPLPALAYRIRALALHLFGHLNGLTHSASKESYMYDFQGVDDLDRMTHFTESQIPQMQATLQEVADVRLEESAANIPTHPFWFVMRSLWIGREEIGNAILRARPWQFPFRLSRLTTAAISALLILLMTAEVWDVGMQQSISKSVALASMVLCLGSLYILKRQQLLRRRHRRSLSEQTVFTSTAISIVVFLGMCTTYIVLFCSAFSLGAMLFPETVVGSWAASLPPPVSLQHYLSLAAFVASFSLLIGALGASFEQHYYFRHITYIDEET